METALKKPKKLVDLLKGKGHYALLNEESRCKLFNRWRKIYHLESKEIDLSFYASYGDLLNAYDKGFNTMFVHAVSR